MRLLYLCSDFGIDPAGVKGASIHLRAITRALAELGADVRLLSPKDGPGGDHPTSRLLSGGCPPADECARLLKSWMSSRGLGDGLSRELRPLLYNAWVRDRAIAALHAHPVDAIVERLALHGHVGVDLADELGLPLIVEVNALLTDESRQFRSLHLAVIAEQIERRVLSRADAVLCVSAPLAERIAELGVPRRRIHVVPNGAEVEHFDDAPPRSVCRESLGLRDEFVVGFLGTLKPWHGADALVEAFVRLRSQRTDARLLIVGSGPEEPALRAILDDAGARDAAIFTGAVEHDRVPALLRAMDVACAPYRALEGFYFSPIKLFEYMAAGVAIVASRIGQIDDVLAHERSALLCKPGDVEELADALHRLARDSSLRARLAQAAGVVVRGQFTWRCAGERVMERVRAAIRDRTERSEPALAEAIP